MSDKKQSRRVALTEEQAASRVGSKMIEALQTILADGVITKREVVALQDWLRRAAALSDLPAIAFLSDEVAWILEDEDVTEAETQHLVKAALRVLPAVERDRLKVRVQEASAKAKEVRKQQRAEEKAKEKAQQLLDSLLPTERQLAFLKALGGSAPDGATKEQVSELIDLLVATRPSPRQRMVLRFWGRTDLMLKDGETVSEWMDSLYSSDPDCRTAWELWKAEHEKEPTRWERIDDIPLGIGQRYLAQVKLQSRAK